MQNQRTTSASSAPPRAARVSGSLADESYTDISARQKTSRELRSLGPPQKVPAGNTAQRAAERVSTRSNASAAAAVEPRSPPYLVRKSAAVPTPTKSQNAEFKQRIANAQSKALPKKNPAVPRDPARVTQSAPTTPSSRLTPRALSEVNLDESIEVYAGRGAAIADDEYPLRVSGVVPQERPAHPGLFGLVDDSLFPKYLKPNARSADEDDDSSDDGRPGAPREHHANEFKHGWFGVSQGDDKRPSLQSQVKTKLQYGVAQTQSLQSQSNQGSNDSTDNAKPKKIYGGRLTEDRMSKFERNAMSIVSEHTREVEKLESEKQGLLRIAEQVMRAKIAAEEEIGKRLAECEAREHQIAEKYLEIHLVYEEQLAHNVGGVADSGQLELIQRQEAELKKVRQAEARRAESLQGAPRTPASNWRFSSVEPGSTQSSTQRLRGVAEVSLGGSPGSVRSRSLFSAPISAPSRRSSTINLSITDKNPESVMEKIKNVESSGVFFSAWKCVFQHKQRIERITLKAVKDRQAKILKRTSDTFKACFKAWHSVVGYRHSIMSRVDNFAPRQIHLHCLVKNVFEYLKLGVQRSNDIELRVEVYRSLKLDAKHENRKIREVEARVLRRLKWNVGHQKEKMQKMVKHANESIRRRVGRELFAFFEDSVEFTKQVISFQLKFQEIYVKRILSRWLSVKLRTDKHIKLYAKLVLWRMRDFFKKWADNAKERKALPMVPTDSNHSPEQPQICATVVQDSAVQAIDFDTPTKGTYAIIEVTETTKPIERKEEGGYAQAADAQYDFRVDRKELLDTAGKCLEAGIVRLMKTALNLRSPIMFTLPNLEEVVERCFDFVSSHTNFKKDNKIYSPKQPGHVLNIRHEEVQYLEVNASNDSGIWHIDEMFIPKVIAMIMTKKTFSEPIWVTQITPAAAPAPPVLHATPQSSTPQSATPQSAVSLDFGPEYTGGPATFTKGGASIGTPVDTVPPLPDTLRTPMRSQHFLGFGRPVTPEQRAKETRESLEYDAALAAQQRAAGWQQGAQQFVNGPAMGAATQGQFWQQPQAQPQAQTQAQPQMQQAQSTGWTGESAKERQDRLEMAALEEMHMRRRR